MNHYQATKEKEGEKQVLQIIHKAEPGPNIATMMSLIALHQVYLIWHSVRLLFANL